MLTRHCFQCGWEYTISGQPGRTECCHQCGADLKICQNCLYFELRAAHQCREKRADPVMDKRTANFCEYFEMIRREWKEQGVDAMEQKARENMKKLFGD